MHLAFIASIVRNELFQKVKNKKEYTIPAIINELEKVVAIKDKEGNYIRRYRLNKVQKEVLQLFGIDDQEINEAIQKL